MRRGVRVGVARWPGDDMVTIVLRRLEKKRGKKLTQLFEGRRRVVCLPAGEGVQQCSWRSPQMVLGTTATCMSWKGEGRSDGKDNLVGEEIVERKWFEFGSRGGPVAHFHTPQIKPNPNIFFFV